MLWRNMLVTEMYRFLGILLKKSLIGGDVKGYKSLWYPTTHTNISPTCQIEVDDYPIRAGKSMQFPRCEQIRASFHPQTIYNKLDNKCHQIKCGIQKLNSAAKRCFIPGKELLFDEGGTPSKSIYKK